MTSAGLPHNLFPMKAGDAGNRGDHHAGEQLHGGDIALVKCSRRRRKNFEDSQGSPVVAQRRDQDRTNTEAAAAGQIDAGISFSVMT